MAFFIHVIAFAFKFGGKIGEFSGLKTATLYLPARQASLAGRISQLLGCGAIELKTLDASRRLTGKITEHPFLALPVARAILVHSPH